METLLAQPKSAVFFHLRDKAEPALLSDAGARVDIPVTGPVAHQTWTQVRDQVKEEAKHGR